MSLPGLSSVLGAVAENGGGGGGGITISISPGDQAASGSVASFTFGAETATPSSGTPSSYSWSVSGFPGTWAIIAGGSTATATIRVTGVVTGDTASGVASCAVVISGVTYYGSANLDYSRS